MGEEIVACHCLFIVFSSFQILTSARNVPISVVMEGVLMNLELTLVCVTEDTNITHKRKLVSVSFHPRNIL